MIKFLFNKSKLIKINQIPLIIQEIKKKQLYRENLALVRLVDKIIQLLSYRDKVILYLK